ncbi:MULTISPECIES: hypothetical protein [Bacteroidales]|jgi:hypothetical protein|uniref:hypothetical protein n=1 Tax=Bacteroidales TaxID=171549 RepID=UPI00259BD1CF|nr:MULTISPECIES: hypothetical protein [Bacteroidales]
MVNNLLGAIENIPTKDLETAVVSNHVLGKGYYFILHDNNELEGPYRVTKKDCGMNHDKQEWFRNKDFFSMWLNNDANKALSIKAKNWLSAVPFMLAFKKSKLHKVKGNEDAIIRAVMELDERCGKMPECAELIGGGREVYKDAVYRLTNCMEKALEYLAEQGETVGDTDIIKIFLDNEDENYIRSGKKYLYCSLFNKDTISVTDGKTSGPSTFFMSYNSKKTYLIPSDMGYSAPFYICVEDAYRMYMLFKFLKMRQKNGVVYIPYNNFDLSGIGSDENTEGYCLKIDNGAITDFSLNILSERKYDFSVVDYIGIKNLKPMKISGAIKRYILGLPYRKNSTGEGGDEYFVPSNHRAAMLMPTFEDDIAEYIETGTMPDLIRRMLWQLAYQNITQCIDDRYLWEWESYARHIVNTWLNIIYNGKEINMQENFTVINNDEDFNYAAGQLAYFLTSRASRPDIKRWETQSWLMINNTVALMVKLRDNLAFYALECPEIEEFTNLVSETFRYAENAKTFYPHRFITGYFDRNVVLEALTDESGSLGNINEFSSPENLTTKLADE